MKRIFSLPAASVFLACLTLAATGLTQSSPRREEHIVRGTVLDAETGQPVERFVVGIYVPSKDSPFHKNATGQPNLVEDPFWHPDSGSTPKLQTRPAARLVDPATGLPRDGVALNPPGSEPELAQLPGHLFTDGAFSMKSVGFTRPGEENTPVSVRVLSNEYETFTSAPMAKSASTPSLKIRLTRKKPFSATLQTAEGRPVGQAKVYIGEPLWLRLADGQLKADADALSMGTLSELETDREGKFQLDAVAVRREFAWAASAEGFAFSSMSDLKTSRTLVMNRMGSVAGRLMAGQRPAVGEHLSLELEFPERGTAQRKPRLTSSFAAVTDGDGRFEFRNVPPGPVMLYRGLNYGRSQTYFGFQRLDVAAGKPTRIVLDEGGHAVFGKLRLPASPVAGMEQGLGFFQVILGTSELPAPTYAGGRSYRSVNGMIQQHRPVLVGSDGSFRTDGLPTGNYFLSLEFHDASEVPPGPATQATVIARATKAFIIEPNGPRSLNLGELELDLMATKLKVGDEAPPLTFKTHGESVRTLAEFRGKAVMLALGSPEHGGARGAFQHRAGMSMSESAEKRTEWVYLRLLDSSRRNHPHHSQLFLGGPRGFTEGIINRDEGMAWLKQFGIVATPAIFLIDAKGRIEVMGIQERDVWSFRNHPIHQLNIGISPPLAPAVQPSLDRRQ